MNCPNCGRTHNRFDVAPVERTGATALAFVVDHLLLLPIGVLIGLAWANTAGESYFGLRIRCGSPSTTSGWPSSSA